MQSSHCIQYLKNEGFTDIQKQNGCNFSCYHDEHGYVTLNFESQDDHIIVSILNDNNKIMYESFSIND